MTSKEEILLPIKILSEISERSSTGNMLGMTFGEIQKKYGLRRRDMKVLVGELRKYYYGIIDMEDGNEGKKEIKGQKTDKREVALYCSNFNFSDILYFRRLPDVTDEDIEEFEFNSENYEEEYYKDYFQLEGEEPNAGETDLWRIGKEYEEYQAAADSDDENVLAEKFAEYVVTADTYIKIGSITQLISEKLNNIDASKIINSENDAQLNEILAKISDDKILLSDVIDRSTSNKILMEAKRKWIMALCKSCALICGGKKFFPRGLYYCGITDRYIGLYEKSALDKQLSRIDLAEFRTPCILSVEEILNGKNVNIQSYLKKIRKTDVVLKVYKDEMEIGKLNSAMFGYDVQDISEDEKCKTISIKVENANDIIPFVLSCGSSVIAESPETLKRDIIEILRKTKDNYN